MGKNRIGTNEETRGPIIACEDGSGWIAYRDHGTDCWPCGEGHTEAEAIADLLEKERR